MSAWDEKPLAMLHKLHKDGVAFAGMAAQINAACGTRYTRNALCGKAHRIGLVRGRPSRPKAAPPKREPRVGIKNPATFQPFTETPDEPGMIKLLDLNHHHCRWPIGDPKADNFAFCGRTSVRGAYCVGHAARAYSGLPARKAAA